MPELGRGTMPFELFLCLLVSLLTLMLAGNIPAMQLTGQLAVFGIFAAWSLFFREVPDALVSAFRQPSTLFFLGLVVLSLLHSIKPTGLSYYPAHSFISARMLACNFMLFLLSASLLTSRGSQTRFFACVTLLGAFEAALGLSQAFSGNRTIFGLVELSEVGRAHGTFYNSDHLSAFLQMSFFCCLGLMLSILPQKTSTWRDRIRSLADREVNLVVLLMLCGVLISLGIVFSASRMGMVSTLAALAVMVTLSLLGRGYGYALRRLAVQGILVGLFATVLGMEIVGRRFLALLEDLDPVSGSRGALWSACLELLQARPWLGGGLGTFRFRFPAHQPASLQAFFDHAHNDYLEVAIDLGVPALLFLLFGGVWFFILFIRGWIGRHARRDVGLQVGAFVGLVSIAVHSGGDFVLRSFANGALFSVLLAVAQGATPAQDDGRHRRQGRSHRSDPMEGAWR